MQTVLIDVNKNYFVSDISADDFLTYTARPLYCAQNQEDNSTKNLAQVFMSREFMERMTGLIQMRKPMACVESAYSVFEKNLNCTLISDVKINDETKKYYYTVLLPGRVLAELVTQDDYIKNILKKI